MKGHSSRVMAAVAISFHPTVALSLSSPPPSYAFARRYRACEPLRATLDKPDTADFFMNDDTEKEWSVKPAAISVSVDSFQRARLAEQLRISAGRQLQTPSALEDGASKASETLSLVSSRLVTDILQPVLNPEIEKDVPEKCILGAAINGSTVTVLALVLLGLPLLQTLVAALNIGVIAAYISITRGAAGDFARGVGRYTMSVADSAFDMYREFDAGRKIEKASKALDTLSRVSKDGEDNSAVKSVLDQADQAVKEVQKAEAELEAAALRRKKALVDATDKLEEVERAKFQVKQQLQHEMTSHTQDKTEDTSLEEEKLWLEEQNRIANERHLARIEEENRTSEESAASRRNPVDYDAPARLAYEATDKSEKFESFLPAYLANTSAMMAKKHKDRSAVENESKQISSGAGQLNRIDSTAKLRVDEDALNVERDVERIMKEEEKMFIEEQQTSEPAMLLDDELDQAAWDASVQLANTLSGEEAPNLFDLKMDSTNDEIDDLLKAELGDLTEDEEELLGKAAREAVRKYEEEMRMKKSPKRALQSSWDDANYAGKKEDTILYSQMTVAELKETLRSKGLKVSGKKSELIERLMEGK